MDSGKHLWDWQGPTGFAIGQYVDIIDAKGIRARVEEIIISRRPRPLYLVCYWQDGHRVTVTLDEDEIQEPSAE